MSGIAGSALGSSAGSMVGDFIGGYMNQNYALSRQHGAQDFAHEQYAGRYQMMVDDLKRAGLNPMLAYTNGVGGTPSSSAASASESSMGTRASSTYNETRIASANEAVLQEQKNKIIAERENIDADTKIKENMPALIMMQTFKEGSSAENLAKQNNRIDSEISEISQRIKVLSQEVENKKSDTELKKKLADSQDYLNALNKAKTMLTEIQGQKQKPHADYSDTWLGDMEAIGTKFWNTVLPVNLFMGK